MSNIFVIGDMHGHIQLALCMAARWLVRASQHGWFLLKISPFPAKGLRPMIRVKTAFASFSLETK